MRLTLKLLLILIFPISIFATTQSTTTRGISIDGTVTTTGNNGDNDGDWEPDENLPGNSTTWHMSWDDNNLYIGRVGGNNAEPQIIYIQAEYSGSTYTSSAFNYDNFTPDFTNMTGINFVAYLKTSYDEFRTYSGGSWSVANTGLTPQYGSDMEITIPWNDITNGNGKPTHFRPVFYQTNGNGGSIWAYGESPMGNPDGPVGSPVISNWWGGYNVTSGVAPNTNMDNGLPVTLITFKARTSAGHVILNWTTASETNNSHFDIEKSSDSYYWALLGTVDGRGTTIQQNEYTRVDENPNTGDNYYRLKQVDFDGKYEYSNTVLATIQSKTIAIYPNPVKDQLFVPSKNRSPGDYIELHSMQGILLQSVPVSSNNISAVNTQTLKSGVYLLSIRNKDGLIQSNHCFVKN